MFSNWQSIALSLLGIGLIVVAIVAIFATDASDAAKTALLTVGSVFLLFALLGRLPTKLAFGAWEVEFGKEQLQDLFDLVKSEAPEIFDDVVRISKDGARDKKLIEDVARTANRDAAEEREAEDSVLNADLATSSLIDSGNQLQRNQSINVPSRGRPPIVDAVLEQSDGKIAIEFKTNWNPTIARVVKARLERVLTSPEILGAVLVVGADRRRDAKLLIDDPRVFVTSYLDLDEVRSYFKIK